MLCFSRSPSLRCSTHRHEHEEHTTAQVWQSFARPAATARALIEIASGCNPDSSSSRKSNSALAVSLPAPHAPSAALQRGRSGTILKRGRASNTSRAFCQCWLLWRRLMSLVRPGSVSTSELAVWRSAASIASSVSGALCTSAATLHTVGPINIQICNSQSASDSRGEQFYRTWARIPKKTPQARSELSCRLALVKAGECHFGGARHVAQRRNCFFCVRALCTRAAMSECKVVHVMHACDGLFKETSSCLSWRVHSNVASEHGQITNENKVC
jgi:hypothetical protein